MDLFDPVHACRRKHQAAPDGNATADIAVSGTAGGEGKAMAGSELDDAYDRCRGSGKSNGVGDLTGAPLVGGVFFADAFVPAEFARLEVPGQA
jgi:hypothetical protein